MKESNTTLAYALGHIDAAYIAAAELPELSAEAPRPRRSRREEQDGPRFWESGWFTAAVSAAVAKNRCPGLRHISHTSVPASRYVQREYFLTI